MNQLLTLAHALVWLALLAGGWLGWQLLRQNGRILLRLDELEKRLDELEFGGSEEPVGLQVGSEAPAFELPDLAGERCSLAQDRGQPLLLIFFNPACGFCREMLPKLRKKVKSTKPKAGMDQSVAGNGSLGEPPKVLIVSTGEAEANRALFAGHQLDCSVLLQKEMEVAAAYRANGTPSGYLVSAGGKIASELAIGGDAVLELLKQKPEGAKPNGDMDKDLLPSNGAGAHEAREERFGNRSLARSRIKRDGLKAGTSAPDFRLPRLDGKGNLTLSELRGKRVLLVFSSPGCGPCNELAPQLEKLHREHPELEVVMIGKGEPAENRAKVKEHGLTFPVVLQQQWEVSRRYAMFATPIAYLIDEKGVIVHDVGVGIDGVLDLTRLAGQPGLDAKTASRSARF